jgi:TonB family protein
MVLGAYLVFVMFRLVLLALAVLRTVQIRRAAHAAAVPQPIESVWRRCQESLGRTSVRLLFSTQVSGPVTAGRTIILPESLLDEASPDVLTTAIGHEMAHIARHDFGGKILLELLRLPVSFHPAAWLIRQGIERTREVACDELVTARLMDAGAYARSIVSIAAGMTALPLPGYTLGAFDGDILEERIRRLVERPAANLKGARLLLLAGLAALGICAVAASSLALNARAQSGAETMRKQGEEAYNRGDYAAAVVQFQNAANSEPANWNAKLSLANALVAASNAPVPWDAASPLAARVRQLYLDVLAQDPRNKQAHQGMINLYTYSRQFDEAHDWALQTIQADPSDPSAYYMAGFADWSMTYPDYAAARQAAGMDLSQPGIIPDAGLRLNVRIKHSAQIEEGMNMLRTALQIDPEYGDAMAYMNLLYRIKAGISETTAEYDDLIGQADDWVGKAMDAKRKQAQNPQRTAQGITVYAPPPPPPPPPPSGGGGGGGDRAIGPFRNEPHVAVVKQVPPVYPEEARAAGVSGLVHLRVRIATDGTVQNAFAIDGNPLLSAAALQAVYQWVFQTTLVEGRPVEVVTTVDVNFPAR